MPKEESAVSNTFNLTIWPAEYFGIPEGETITRIEYIFTNKDGTLNITGTDDKIAAEGERQKVKKNLLFANLPVNKIIRCLFFLLMLKER